jgi:hypothetical protein
MMRKSFGGHKIERVAERAHGTEHMAEPSGRAK